MMTRGGLILVTLCGVVVYEDLAAELIVKHWKVFHLLDASTMLVNQKMISTSRQGIV